MGSSLLLTGDIAGGRAQYDRAIALYDPAVHRPLATRFGQDVRVAILSYRAWALWLLGYPETARTDAEDALNDAREFGQAATLMYALGHAPLTHFWSGNYAASTSLVEEVIALSDEKAALIWNAFGKLHQAGVCALTRKASDAIEMLTSAITTWRSTGATAWYAKQPSTTGR
jgi:tetratricopeptide (TPR) repeat protein